MNHDNIALGDGFLSHSKLCILELMQVSTSRLQENISVIAVFDIQKFVCFYLQVYISP